MTIAEHHLSCDVRAPSLARRWAAECLRSTLGDAAVTDGLVDDAVLCLSELVTNAVHAGCSALHLRLAVDEESVRLYVRDDAPGLPTPQQAGSTEGRGRGLKLVEALSRRWGVDPDAKGKAVWAALGRSA
jgi:anti-sigma regulatory factor (Ser/Thr protein kinase)